MKSIIAFLILIALSVAPLSYQMLTAKTFITQPEVGITCIAVRDWTKDKVPAGCYRGDIYQKNNWLDPVATKRYQGGMNE